MVLLGTLNQNRTLKVDFYVKNCPNFSLKNINLGHQLLLKTFFDKFNFKNNLFLKLGRKIVNFQNLSTLSEKFQKKFRCYFRDYISISFIVISFH